MRRRTVKRRVIFWVFISTCIFIPSLAFSYNAPTLNDHFFGDATGDLNVTGADLTQHRNYTNFLPYGYDTLQPKNGAQVDGQEVRVVANQRDVRSGTIPGVV